MKRIADAEASRLRELLTAHGVSGGNCAFGDVWAAVSEWMLTGSGDALSAEVLVGTRSTTLPAEVPDRPRRTGDARPGACGLVFLRSAVFDFG